MSEAEIDWALVDSDGNVHNVISWDGVAQWSPPAGLTAIKTNGVYVDIGRTVYVHGEFVTPVPPLPEPPDTPENPADFSAMGTP